MDDATQTKTASAKPAKPKRFRKHMPKLSLSRVAGLLMATAFAGQLLGFLRTKLINANFPAVGPQSTDSYFAAFNIPDFFFFTLAAGALSVAFIPVLNDHFQKGDRKGMWELSASLFNLMALVMAAVGVLIFIFARPLIHHVVAPNLPPAQLGNAVTIMRFLAFNPLLFTISGVITSVQQTMGRFVFYAIAPLFYNLSIIASIFIFRDNVGIVGAGIGAFAGAVLQLVIVFFGLAGARVRWHPHILWRSRDFRTILRQLPPRSLDQGMDQILGITETRFAQRLGQGYVTYYNNAYILHTAPILLLGTAISTAAFPRMTARLSQGRPDLFRREFLRTLRVMIWLAMPVVVVCFFARGYLARIIYSSAAPVISLIFGFLVAAIFFRTIYTIISRWFYAQKNTWTPLFVSVFAVGLNVGLAYFLSQPSSYGVAGLAISQSIVAGSEVLILSIIMFLRDKKLFDRYFWGGILKIVAVTGFSVLAGYGIVQSVPLGINDTGILTLGGKLLIITVVVFLVHLLGSTLFGLEEVRPIYHRLKKLFTKQINIE
jgi:putative peptidoglycan lipid II flippase